MEDMDDVIEELDRKIAEMEMVSAGGSLSVDPVAVVTLLRTLLDLIKLLRKER